VRFNYSVRRAALEQIVDELAQNPGSLSLSWVEVIVQRGGAFREFVDGIRESMEIGANPFTITQTVGPLAGR
jgi:hypothetical protein